MTAVLVRNAIFVRPGAFEHDSGRAELVAAVDHRHTAGEAGEERRLLHRRVAAADDRDVLIAEEEAVTRGTGAHSHAQQRFLTGDAKVARGRAHGEDHRAGPVGLVADGDCLDGTVEGDLVDVFHPQVGAKAQRLLTHLVHQFGPGDAVAETGVVLHLGGGHQGAAELAALEDERLELCARSVHGSRVAGRS